MRSGTVARTYAGSAILVALCMYAASRLLARTMADSLRAPGKDRVDELIERFEVIKKELPPYGVVGYLAEPGDRADIDRIVEFRIAQYALCPVVLVDKVRPGLVIGSYHDAAAFAVLREAKKLVVLKDLGKGLVLLRGGAE